LIACAHAHADIGQAGSGEERLELFVAKSLPAVAQRIPDPALLMRPEVEHEDAAALAQDAHGLGHGAGGVARMVQRL